MPIKTIIHSIDKKTSRAIFSLIDEGRVYVDRKNTRIELDENGNANTVWLNAFTKYNSIKYRLNHIDRDEGDLV
jgi:hypothetical protein